MNTSEHSICMVPIDRIMIVNPRSRGRAKFKQIVGNISSLGLKKPITVAARPSKNGEPQYDLVCGQGRLEAYRALGETEVPAFVVDATKEELMLMSLAENLARRFHSSADLMREIAALKERGHTYADISKKTDLHIQYVKGIIRLLNKGEERLVRASRAVRLQAQWSFLSKIPSSRGQIGFPHQGEGGILVDNGVAASPGGGQMGNVG